MARLTIGSMVAGLLQYIVIMTIFLPAAGGCINPTTHKSICAVPAAFNTSYSALVASQGNVLSSSILHNITQSAQSNSTGVGAALNNPQFTIGGFLYAGLGFFFTALLNLGPIYYNIFSTTISNIALFNYAALSAMATISTVLSAYIGYEIAVKVIGWIQKSSPEDS